MYHDKTTTVAPTVPPDPKHTLPPSSLKKEATDMQGTSASASMTDPDRDRDTLPSAIALPSTKAEILPGLPRLDYNIWHYKTKLLIIVTLLVLESALIPIALFYGLRLTSLRIGLIFAVITSFFGIVTGIEYGFRSLKLIGYGFHSWKLTQKGDEYRPLGGKKWHMDYIHHTLGLAYFVMSAILIGFSVPHTPWIRPLAIPVPYFLIQVGAQMLWSAVMHALGKPAPFRISSIAKGEKILPMVYTIVEDIIAVDGNAGKSYRERLRSRYAVSPRFRTLVIRQNWFWTIGALVDGVGTMVVIWTVPEVVAYGVGRSFPLRASWRGLFC